jgi:Fe2+ or Zn2+ uptake regulation protein
VNDSHALLAPTLLRFAELRVTRQPIAVLEALHARLHASAADVLAAVSIVLPGVSHQAVYDCLADITNADLLRRINIDGGAALYETRTRDNHRHCVCRGCGIVVDAACTTGAAPCLDVADAAGFIIDEAESRIEGCVLTAR